jgi:hypothetical protein
MTDTCAVSVPPTGRRRGQRSRGFVYFVTDGEAVKIGFSTCVEDRLSAMQTSHPKALTIIGAFPGYVYEESRLHTHFGHLHIRGEWFRPDPAITALVAKLETVRRNLDLQVTTVSDVALGKPPKQRTIRPRVAPSEAVAFMRWRKKQAFASPEIAHKAYLVELDMGLLPKLNPKHNAGTIALVQRNVAEFAAMMATTAYADHQQGVA